MIMTVVLSLPTFCPSRSLVMLVRFPPTPLLPSLYAVFSSLAPIVLLLAFVSCFFSFHWTWHQLHHQIKDFKIWKHILLMSIPKPEIVDFTKRLRVVTINKQHRDYTTSGEQHHRTAPYKPTGSRVAGALCLEDKKAAHYFPA